MLVLPFVVKMTLLELFLDILRQDSSVAKSTTAVFTLREHKLRILEQAIQAVTPNRVKIAHLRDVEVDPECFVRDVVTSVWLFIQKNYAT